MASAVPKRGAFWEPCGLGLLGRSESALRQGFCLRQKRLNGAYRAAPSQMGPQWPTARQETDVFLLVAYALPNHGVGRPKTRGVLGTLRIGPARAE